MNPFFITFPLSDGSYRQDIISSSLFCLYLNMEATSVRMSQFRDFKVLKHMRWITSNKMPQH